MFGLVSPTRGVGDGVGRPADGGPVHDAANTSTMAASASHRALPFGFLILGVVPTPASLPTSDPGPSRRRARDEQTVAPPSSHRSPTPTRSAPRPRFGTRPVRECSDRGRTRSRLRAGDPGATRGSTPQPPPAHLRPGTATNSSHRPASLTTRPYSRRWCTCSDPRHWKGTSRPICRRPARRRRRRRSGSPSSSAPAPPTKRSSPAHP